MVIPGGSGQIGIVLTRALSGAGYDVVVLSRRGEAPEGARAVRWDGRTLGAWAGEIDGADVVINLAGRSVDCRYTAANRRAIMDSRVESTRVVAEAIAASSSPPPVWLQASTATIYAHRYDAANDERTGALGGDEADAPDTWRFSIDVAQAWERAAVAPAGTRLVLLRSAMTMSPDRGGIFDTLLRLVRFGVGGTAGSGRQYVSWIHHRDFVRAIVWLIEHDDVSGPVNVAAPNPLPNRDFMRALREAWGTRIGLPATRWMLEAGALALGPRPSSCSRAAASFRGSCSSGASRSITPTGRRPRASSWKRAESAHKRSDLRTVRHRFTRGAERWRGAGGWSFWSRARSDW